MAKAFQNIENALSVVQGGMKQKKNKIIVDREDVGVGRIQVEWEIRKVAYKVETFPEDAHAFVTKSKQLAFEEKEECALLAKFHALDSKIL